MLKAVQHRSRLNVALLSLVVSGAAAGAQAAARPLETVSASLAAKIPARPAGARSGSEFVAFVRALDSAERERAILDELVAGNLPPFLRRLQPVELSCCDASRPAEHQVTAQVWVMPDYLAIGSDDDFVRFPVNFDTATAVARRFGFVLPTTAIVDAIYRQAELRLPPLPMPPGPAMTSTAYFQAHDEKIRAQLNGRRPEGLTAGHKKDYVLTRRLAQAPNREAIYGWHRAAGSPIQPLSLVHGVRYADYSHGVRLVSETVYVDGAPRSIYELLASPLPARALSSEGVIAEARELMRRGRSAIDETGPSAPAGDVPRSASASRPARRATPGGS
jgi:hypothetical protein